MIYIKNADFQMRNTCVTFGVFDGMHLGHRAVLSRVLAQKELTSAVLVLEEEGEVLSTPREKQYLLGKSGVDAVISLPASVAEQPERFVREYIVGRLGAKKVVAGRDCRFGKDGSGDITLLRKMGETLGFQVIPVDTVKVDGQAVARDAILASFAAGDFKRTCALLGGPYLLIGPVTHGKHAGSRHGMPTANLAFDKRKILPPLGVYGSRSHVGGDIRKGMTNIGFRPSDDNLPYISVETLLLDFDGDLYDREQILEVYVYVRGVRKFAGGLDEVRRQIDRDIAAIRNDTQSMP